MLNITTGFPQGSIIGPLLFIFYINDIPNSTNSSRSVIYADDSTLCGTLNTFGQYTSDSINLELQKVTDWLAVNKPSLNIKKTKHMFMHTKNKYMIKPNIIVNGEEIECVHDFNLLGITINESLQWKPHENLIANKISKSVGILNKLKHILPKDIRILIFNTLISSQFNYGILIWGYQCNRH